MIPRLLVLLFLSAAAAFAAVVPPPSDSLVEERDLVPRKTAVTLMTFPVPNCSSNGIIETRVSDRCERFPTRLKGLTVRSITSGCRGECSIPAHLDVEVTEMVAAFVSKTANCSGARTPLVQNRCYDVTDYVTLMTIC
ncbi:hypothetical protein QBC34DRAFT_407344 [Podospora aff. communis PSN243]|uniref:Uncharacterized protein n=1 Tax=Podospora aff. communis PSN243 TaxID=3040156 RepID=A0AAV9GJJ3_9PEZI|nr:hypothetical protein QBC34DRAFT_407344 [Podospora aff. communis PSN243]